MYDIEPFLAGILVAHHPYARRRVTVEALRILRTVLAPIAAAYFSSVGSQQRRRAERGRVQPMKQLYPPHSPERLMAAAEKLRYSAAEDRRINPFIACFI